MRAGPRDGGIPGGLTHERPAQRVARLRESLETMKSAWAGELRLPTDAGGEVERAVPEGIQRSHVPVLIGGHSDAVLTLAAREADIVGLSGITVTGSTPAPTGAGFETIADRVRLVREQAGERIDSIELNALAPFTSIGGDTDATVRGVAATLGMPEDVVRASPLLLIGSVSEVVDKLVATREQLGISYGGLRHRDGRHTPRGRRTRRHVRHHRTPRGRRGVPA